MSIVLQKPNGSPLLFDNFHELPDPYKDYQNE